MCVCVYLSLQVTCLYKSLHYPLHPTHCTPTTSSCTHPSPHTPLMCREEGDTWVSDGKLENHTDWVRDVAWAPSIGLPVSRIASCSQDGRVIVWRKDDTEGGTWTPQVNGMAMARHTGPCMTVWVCWYVGD